MTSPYDATASELIAAGWGDTMRAEIPADWQSRCGPDLIPGQTNRKRCESGWRAKKQNYRQRRAAYLLREGRTEEWRAEFIPKLC